eukprot:3816807-Pleurochrysis_carterae.AAC.2
MLSLSRLKHTLCCENRLRETEAGPALLRRHHAGACGGNAGIQYLHIVNRPVVGVCAREAQPPHGGHAGRDAPEDRVLPIKPWAWCQCDEEL